MAETAAGTFAVLAAGKEDLRPEVLSQALAAFRGIPRADAAMHVRRARGILAEGLDGASAFALADRLESAGIGARVVETAAMAVLPPVRLLARAAPGPDGVLVTVRGESEFLVEGDRIRLVALAPWTETIHGKATVKEGPSAQEVVIRAGIIGATGLPIGLGKKKSVEKATTKTELRFALDLHLRGPADLLRVDAAKFDFSGLGKRMAYNAHGNMKALLEGMREAAPGAATNPGADLLLGGGRLSALGYESLEDLAREERWLLTVLPA